MLPIRPPILPSRRGGAAKALSASSSETDLSPPVRSVSMIAITLTAAVAKTIKLPIAVENEPTNTTSVASVLWERERLRDREREHEERETGGESRGRRERGQEKFSSTYGKGEPCTYHWKAQPGKAERAHADMSF